MCMFVSTYVFKYVDIYCMEECMYIYVFHKNLSSGPYKGYLFHFDSLCRLSREILPTLKYLIVKNQVCMPRADIYTHSFMFKSF